MGMESNGDTFAIQPFASQPGQTNASSSFLSTTPPTNASLAGPSGVAQSLSVAPTTSPQPQLHGGGANPYRMGSGMAARKPAYGTSGIASYAGGGGVVGNLPTSQPTMVGPVFSPEMSSMPMRQPSLQPQVQWHSSLDRSSVHIGYTTYTRSINTIYCLPSAHTLSISYFFDQMPRLLFISLLVLCGYYSRAATIRGRRLFEEIR